MNKKGKALIGILVVLLVALIVWAVRTVPAPPACLEAGTAALASLDRRVTALEEWRHRLMSTV